MIPSNIATLLIYLVSALIAIAFILLGIYTKLDSKKDNKDIHTN